MYQLNLGSKVLVQQNNIPASLGAARGEGVATEEGEDNKKEEVAGERR